MSVGFEYGTVVYARVIKSSEDAGISKGEG